MDSAGAIVGFVTSSASGASTGGGTVGLGYLTAPDFLGDSIVAPAGLHVVAYGRKWAVTLR